MSKPFNKLSFKPKTLIVHNAQIFNARDLIPCPLEHNIELQTLQLGGRISELERWLVDSIPEDENEDHWMNLRPY